MVAKEKCVFSDWLASGCWQSLARNWFQRNGAAAVEAMIGRLQSKSFTIIHSISPCLIAVTLFQMLLKLSGLLASVCRQVCVFHANYSGRWQPASDKSNHKQVLAVGRSLRLTSPGNSNQFRNTRFPSNQRLPGVKNWSLGPCDWHFLIKQEQWATRNVQATSNNEKIKLCEKLQC